MPHPQTEHVIILMLENRSFDHLFGFLDHPNPFEGLHGGPVTNPDNAGNEIPATPDATLEVARDPNHRHFGVMFQLTETDPSGNPPHYQQPYPINNRGFVKEYERRVPGRGAEIMRCQAPGNIPVMATLAKSFVLCDHWFASVPGQTWPNRFFAHAAQSSATVNNYLALYGMRTIFHALSDAGVTWKIFHHGDSHARTMPVTWPHILRMPKFFERVAADDLPQYSFIEPNHLGDPAVTNSQHPGKNETGTGGADFKAGEQLIRSVYRALIANETVWRKSMLVITYDEHGGFFDHVPPPPAVAPDPRLSPERFAFDLLGVRVPAVIVSPYVAAGTVDTTVYDHSSIVASVREQFGIATSLTRRDRTANTFWRNLTLGQPRLAGSIPALDGPEFAELEMLGAAPESAAGERPPDDDELDMVWIAQQLDRVMDAEQAGAAGPGPESALEPLGPPAEPPLETQRDVGDFAQDVDARFVPPADPDIF